MERNRSDLTSKLQAIRRAPTYPLPVPPPDSSLRSPSPSIPIETKPDAQQNEKTGAVPVEFAYVNLPIQANNKEASSDFEVPIHKNNRVGMMPATVEPVRQSSPLGMAKTKSKPSSAETSVSVSHQGHGKVMQEEGFTSKDPDRAVEVARMTKPGASDVAVLEKAKSKTETASPSKLASGQTSGGRTNGNLKVESFPRGSTQEEKVKPNPVKVPITETFGGSRNTPRKDQSREVKEKGEDINDRVSDYISRAKMRIRTMSMGAEQRDSQTDGFGNYIQQAKMKIRTMSGISGDKNVQSK